MSEGIKIILSLERLLDTLETRVSVILKGGNEDDWLVADNMLDSVARVKRLREMFSLENLSVSSLQGTELLILEANELIMQVCKEFKI